MPNPEEKKEALDALSFQSNLLALSAALGAATAAEGQERFTLVASELTHLARTAKETAALIEKAVRNQTP